MTLGTRLEFPFLYIVITPNYMGYKADRYFLPKAGLASANVFQPLEADLYS